MASFRALLTTADALDTDVSGVDLVIEAIVEDLAVKRSVFAQLDGLAKDSALLATNTSSISVTAIAAATSQPGRVVGLHFFNPVPVLPLVEVVRGLRTEEESVERAVAFATRLGKTPVVVNDAPGFVSNRVLMPMINEAVFALSEGVATRDAIDEVMKLGMSHPIGPLALADLIGLDVCLHILETLQADFGDDKYRPAPLMRRMVAAGRLGRKSGEGFYRYGWLTRLRRTNHGVRDGRTVSGSRNENRPVRVLIAKPGLDGHDRGAKVLVRALRDAGFEVIYTGLFQTPEMIGRAALDEDVDVVGLSILSGAHLPLFPRIMAELRQRGLDDVLVVAGGTIPEEDVPLVKEMGVAEVFGPGTALGQIVAYINANAPVRDDEG